MFSKIQKIHFVGIGGVGMSGIAEVLLNLGYQVSGSDSKRGTLSARLKRLGAVVYYSHRAEHVGDAHVVVMSSAISPENPEIVAARGQGIPVIRRAEMLAELMRLKYGICIAGSHGKTTTTSLIATILYKGGLDPTMVIGGKVESFKSNARLGKGDFFVAESDESDGSFLKMMSTVAVVTNIDPEHLDHYGSFAKLQDAFAEFMSRVPFYGAVIGCCDHPVVRQLLKDCDRPSASYGLSEDAQLRAANIVHRGLSSQFDVYRHEQRLGTVTVALGGTHSVLNSLAAIAVGLHLDIPFEKIAAGLKSFRGIGRRCEVYLDGPVTIIDDYGHHPVEMQATIRAIRQAYPDRPLKVCFQPHRYSRTFHLFRELVDAFDGADFVCLNDIYAASEKNTFGVTGVDLFNAVAEKYPALFVPDPVKNWKMIADAIVPGDVVLTLGAGSVGQLPKLLTKKFKGE